MSGVTTALPRPGAAADLAARTLAAWRARRTWAAVAYLSSSAVLGPAWGTVLLTGMSALAWGPFGAPPVAATLALARQGARVERERAAALVGVRIREPYRRLSAGRGPARLREAAADPATWRDPLYLLLLLPVGVLSLLALALPAAGPVAAAFALWPGRPALPLGLTTVDAAAEWGVVAVLGLALLPFAPLAWQGAATAHAELARVLLGPTASALVARVDELSDSRARAVDAAAAERRRIERDLHDGAQQRLVALALDLGMARERFDSDPAAARALVDRAHGEAKRALAELRDLARGIHPAVLTDRGLDAALSAVAARSPVPVTVEVDLPSRPPGVVEATAYFVVTEALTNVARHARARAATVSVRAQRAQEGRVVVEVTDDGIGGADARRGSGLHGLADRVAALDGTLAVTSPPGGPTTVRAVL
jgi:signal transduction histidine kinase